MTPPLPWRRRPVQSVSVVVPAYGVEATLERSLDSILSQPVRDLQVVVVDDGSPDRTGEIADAYSARDRRVTVLHQVNGGVSRARNAAMAHVAGELVTFVDPDDFLPTDAWTPMLRSLERTGSDFAIGMMERVLADGRRVRPPLLHRNHAVERLGVTIDEVPLLIADVFPCNKMFRTEFWHRAGLSFPPDTSYEDNVFSAEAYLAGSRFDVLTQVVYDWYVRGEGSSDTNQRGRLKNLRDRLATKRATLDRVLAHGNPELVDTLYRQVLPIDMWEHFRAAVRPGTEEPEVYWRELRDGVRQLWNDSTVPFPETAVPPGQRLMGWLVSQDRRDDLAQLIALIDGPGVPTQDGVYLHPWRDEPGVPAGISRV